MYKFSQALIKLREIAEESMPPDEFEEVEKLISSIYSIVDKMIYGRNKVKKAKKRAVR